MKPSRFITGYANYRIDQISREQGLTDEEKNEKIRKVDRAVRAHEAGAVTVDEAMKSILEA